MKQVMIRNKHFFSLKTQLQRTDFNLQNLNCKRQTLSQDREPSFHVGCPFSSDISTQPSSWWWCWQNLSASYLISLVYKKNSITWRAGLAPDFYVVVLQWISWLKDQPFSHCVFNNPLSLLPDGLPCDTEVGNWNLAWHAFLPVFF